MKTTPVTKISKDPITSAKKLKTAPVRKSSKGSITSSKKLKYDPVKDLKESIQSAEKFDIIPEKAKYKKPLDFSTL